MTTSPKSTLDLTYINTLDQLDAVCRVLHNAEQQKAKHPPSDPLHEQASRAWDMAFDRMCQLSANQFDPQTDLERDCLVALAAYEWVLRVKSGHKRPAIRLRHSIAEKGIIGAVSTAVGKGKNTVGLKTLIGNKKIGFSFEEVVIKYRDEFPDKIVRAAEKALSEF